MIDISHLHKLYPVHCYSPKGDTVSFEAIRDLVGKTARDFGVPISLFLDEIRTEDNGAIVIEDCLVVYHPEHRYDYFSIVFRIRRENESAFIQKNLYGKSLRLDRCEAYGSDSQDEDIVDSITRNEEHESERNYYRAMQAIFKYHGC